MQIGKAILFVMFTAAIFTGCHSVQQHENLNAVLWVQTSAEYKGTCLQAYNSAKLAIDAALQDETVTATREQMPGYETLPPAVILDVDETVLDNAPYQARLIRGGKKYDKKTWQAWCLECNASPIPGAVEFTQHAHKKGVTVFYVTNRDVTLEAATRENLKKHGFPVQEKLDVLLLKNEKEDWTSDKRSRRKYIARTHRIIMLCGDNLGDFTGSGKGPITDRNLIATSQNKHWGKTWIALPNPTYGYWEGSTINYDYSASDNVQLEMKKEALMTK